MPSPTNRSSELVEIYWQKCAKGLGTVAFNAIISVSYMYWQNIHLLNLSTEISLQFSIFFFPKLWADYGWVIFFSLLLFLASQLYVPNL